jgi:hypothetical protein
MRIHTVPVERPTRSQVVDVPDGGLFHFADNWTAHLSDPSLGPYLMLTSRAVVDVSTGEMVPHNAHMYVTLLPTAKVVCEEHPSAPGA